MRRLFLTIMSSIIIANLIISPCFADPWRKLGRGLVNIVTGVVEVPKEVISTSKEENALVGLTWGLVKGIGAGLVRTGTGIYETVTFPIPAPAEFEPILDPEFVFEDWE